VDACHLHVIRRDPNSLNSFALLGEFPKGYFTGMNLRSADLRALALPPAAALRPGRAARRLVKQPVFTFKVSYSDVECDGDPKLLKWCT